MIRLLLLLLLLVPKVSSSTNLSEPIELDFKDLFGNPLLEITYSDDGLTVMLPKFRLQIYDTNGDLPQESIDNVLIACNSFLLQELNALNAPVNLVDKVDCEALSNLQVVMPPLFRHLLPVEKQTGPTRRERIEWEEHHGSLETLEDEKNFLRGRRNQQDNVGSEFLMKVNVTFDRTPSPSDDVVIQQVKDIMVDLQNLVTNITALNDPLLKDVFLAIRLEVPTDSPTVTPTISPGPSMTPSNTPTTLPPTAPLAPPAMSPVVSPTQVPDTSGNISPSTALDTAAPTSKPVAPTAPSENPAIVLTPMPVASTSAPIVSTTSTPSQTLTSKPTCDQTTISPVCSPTESGAGSPSGMTEGSPSAPTSGLTDGSSSVPTSSGNPSPNSSSPDGSPTEGSTGSPGEPTDGAPVAPTSPTTGGAGSPSDGGPSIPPISGNSSPSSESPVSPPSEASTGSPGEPTGSPGEPTDGTPSAPTSPTTGEGGSPTDGGPSAPAGSGNPSPSSNSPAGSPTKGSTGSPGGEPGSPTEGDPSVPTTSGNTSPSSDSPAGSPTEGSTESPAGAAGSPSDGGPSIPTTSGNPSPSSGSPAGSPTEDSTGSPAEPGSPSDGGPSVPTISENPSPSSDSPVSPPSEASTGSPGEPTGSPGEPTDGIPSAPTSPTAGGAGSPTDGSPSAPAGSGNPSPSSNSPAVTTTDGLSSEPTESSPSAPTSPTRSGIDSPTDLSPSKSSDSPAGSPTEGSPTNDIAVIGPGSSNPGNSTDEGSNGILIISSVVGVAAAGLLLLIVLLLVRRRREDDETIVIREIEPVSDDEVEKDFFAFLRRRRPREESSSEGDIESSGNNSSMMTPLSPNFENRSMGGDSVFSGLTDILTDTGSPRLRQVKSVSSASTVKAHNLIGQSPYSTMRSTTGVSTLFAFAEGDEESESQATQSMDESDAVVTDDKDSVRLDAVPIETKTPLRSNSTRQLPSSVIPKSPSVDPPATGAFVAGSAAIAAVGAAAAAAFGFASSTPRKDEALQEEALQEEDGAFPSVDGAFPTPSPSPARSARQHAGKGQADGSSEYQEAMHPLDWSFKSDANADENSTLSSSEDRFTRRFIFAQHEAQQKKSAKSAPPRSPIFSPQSQRSKISDLSPGSVTSKESEASASRQLISDLVWLERKIADVRQSSAPEPPSPGSIHEQDSLSYISRDAPLSPGSSHGETTTIDSNGIMQNIVCRDCYAPPGKLQIVIHSTKDGPAVHTVKTGSSLEGHIFPGDLIIAVDNVDTRTFTAEQVMKMMTAKSGFERKITVLHFEN